MYCGEVNMVNIGETTIQCKQHYHQSPPVTTSHQRTTCSCFREQSFLVEGQLLQSSPPQDPIALALAALAAAAGAIRIQVEEPVCFQTLAHGYQGENCCSGTTFYLPPTGQRQEDYVYMA